MIKLSAVATLAIGAALSFAPITAAQAQQWTAWNSADASNVFGTLSGVNVTYTGARNGVQFANGTGTVGGINYFNTPAAPYTQNGLSAPPLGFVQINAPVQNVTITFAEAVINPYLAFISVGRLNAPVTYEFAAGTPSFVILSNNNNPNCAFWGCGSATTTATSITGREFSGTVRFNGTVSSLTFSTNPGEFWHGFTVGADRVQPAVVPEPASLAMLGLGLFGLAVVARRRA